MIKIAYAPDENYVGITIISMLSILENKQDENIEFLILNSGLSYRALNKFEWIKQYKECSIRFIEVNREEFSNFPLVNWITTAAWFRTQIANLCVDCDKVLYLDSDTMVLTSLKELFQIDLKDNYVAAVSLPKSNYLNLKSKTYFNSGVMLINCKTWRDEQVFKQIKTYTHMNKKHIKCADQDVLNVICDLRKLDLPPEYNYCEAYRRSDYEIMKNPKIVHFVGPNPNRFDCIHSLKYKWLEYAIKTPFYDEFVTQNIYNLIKMYIKLQFDDFKFSTLAKFSFGKMKNRYKTKSIVQKRLLNTFKY